MTPASLAEGDVDRLALRLRAARLQASSTTLLTEEFPALTIDDAYRIARRTGAMSGSPRVGIKLGFTSAAMRRQMNIATPNHGWLLADMDLATARPRFIHPRIEPEIALLTRLPVGDAPLAGDGLLRTLDSVHPALEIVDTRYHEYRFTAADNTADMSSAAGFVLGPAHPPARLRDACSVMLAADGATLGSGDDADAMGGPLEAFAWLVRQLAAAHEVLPAGSIVLTGGLTAAPLIVPGAHYIARFSTLGAVEFELAEHRDA